MAVFCPDRLRGAVSARAWVRRSRDCNLYIDCAPRRLPIRDSGALVRSVALLALLLSSACSWLSVAWTLASWAV